MIDQDHAKLGFEVARDLGPHVLVATKAVREHHRPRTAAGHIHIITSKYHVDRVHSVNRQSAKIESRAKRIRRGCELAQVSRALQPWLFLKPLPPKDFP